MSSGRELAGTTDSNTVRLTAADDGLIVPGQGGILQASV